MQTFLPYSSFVESARVLDRQRLGKQRVEVLQLLKANFGLTKGWVNHPAARMWRGYETALTRYGLVMCNEWMHRGYEDTCRDKIRTLAIENGVDLNGETQLPWWFYSQQFILSHQSNLVRKDPEHYRVFFPDVPDNLPYLWPESDMPYTWPTLRGE